MSPGSLFHYYLQTAKKQNYRWASFVSCRVKIFCQMSSQRSCWAVGSLPGCLKALLSSSRNLARRTLMTSIVFQSGTENRARFPSRMMTPE